MRCEGLVSSDCYAEEHFILMCGKITHLYQYQKTNDKTSGIFKILLLYAMLTKNKVTELPATSIPTAEDIKIQE